jgi:hypothetical protein
MNKKQIKQEWKKLKSLIIHHRPIFDGPYPPKIVKFRELLIYAQVHLSNIMDSKNRNDERMEAFETEMYELIMSIFDNWYKNEQEITKI